MTTLKATDLQKVYRNRKVVDGVSIEVSTGQVVGLLGPNGAGKTTCFYMIVGLIKSDGGEIKLGDNDITRHPMHARAKVGLGYLPQEASVFRRLTVEENLLAILQTRDGVKITRQREILEHLLQDLHISHLRDNQGISLSGGERRRVEIARALAMEPKFILLDEPFAGVDPIAVLDIQRIIQQLTERDIGVLITDHNVRETLGICSRAYILSEGQVIAAGDPHYLLNHQQVREVYLGHNFSL